MPTPSSQTLKYLLLTGASIIVLVSTSMPTHSAPPPILPNPATSLEQHFQQPSIPESKPAAKIHPPDQPPAPTTAADVRFLLRQLVIEGGTVFAKAELDALYQPLIGHQISIQDFYNIRNDVTAKYLSNGYMLSFAVIPRQNLDNGIARIKIIEGFVEKVSFVGEVTDRFEILKSYADKIKDARPLNIKVLERYVMLMGDLPGITARAVFQPPDPNSVGSNVIIYLDRKPVDASVTVDNRGTRSIGAYQFSTELALNDAIGQFDQTKFRGMLTPEIEELRFADIEHTEQLGTDGLTLAVGARKYWSDPGDVYKQYDLKSQVTAYRSSLSYPMIRTRSETLRINADLNYRDSRQNLLGLMYNVENVRYITLGSSFDFADGWDGSNLFQVGLNHGLDVANAKTAYLAGQPRVYANPTYNKVTFSGQRLQKMTDHYGILFGLEGQYSPDMLVSGEQYGVGGKLFGRGFDTNDVVGDSGGSAKIELQYTPAIEIPKVQYVQFFSYLDYGKVWVNHAGTADNTLELASVGGGFRFGITETIIGSLEVGVPLFRNITQDGNRDPRGFFSISAKY